MRRRRMVVEVEAIAGYLEGLLPERDSLLKRLEAEAREENIPIVGPRVGGILRMLAYLVGARRILELGTAVGYSAIWLTRGMGEGGKLTSVEANNATAERARRNLAEAGLGGRVEVQVGQALSLLPKMNGPYELIFNDIDKESYPQVIPYAKELLAPGGLLVTDNVLWSGRVADPRETDSWTAAIRTYNRNLAEDEDMETVILPVRDGVSISVKRS